MADDWAVCMTLGAEFVVVAVSTNFVVAVGRTVGMHCSVVVRQRWTVGVRFVVPMPIAVVALSMCLCGRLLLCQQQYLSM